MAATASSGRMPADGGTRAGGAAIIGDLLVLAFYATR
jgi:hypothetical protein